MSRPKFDSFQDYKAIKKALIRVLFCFLFPEVFVKAVGDAGNDLVLIVVRSHQSVLAGVGHIAHFHDGYGYLTPVDAAHGIRLDNASFFTY